MFLIFFTLVFSCHASLKENAVQLARSLEPFKNQWRAALSVKAFFESYNHTYQEGWKSPLELFLKQEGFICGKFYENAVLAMRFSPRESEKMLADVKRDIQGIENVLMGVEEKKRSGSDGDFVQKLSDFIVSFVERTRKIELPFQGTDYFSRVFYSKGPLQLYKLLETFTDNDVDLPFLNLIFEPEVLEAEGGADLCIWKKEGGLKKLFDRSMECLEKKITPLGGKEGQDKGLAWEVLEGQFFAVLPNDFSCQCAVQILQCVRTISVPFTRKARKVFDIKVLVLMAGLVDVLSRVSEDERASWMGIGGVLPKVMESILKEASLVGVLEQSNLPKSFISLLQRVSETQAPKREAFLVQREGVQEYASDYCWAHESEVLVIMSPFGKKGGPQHDVLSSCERTLRNELFYAKNIESFDVSASFLSLQKIFDISTVPASRLKFYLMLLKARLYKDPGFRNQKFALSLAQTIDLKHEPSMMEGLSPSSLDRKRISGLLASLAMACEPVLSEIFAWDIQMLQLKHQKVNMERYMAEHDVPGAITDPRRPLQNLKVLKQYEQWLQKHSI